MNSSEQGLTVDSAKISEQIRASGIAGAGGAGFPSYAKWRNPDSIKYLMVNHQESEPNYYADKWLGRECASQFATLFDDLLDEIFDAIVVGTKKKYRPRWTQELETAIDGTVVDPKDLPMDMVDKEGVIFAYTPNVYTYSEESVLLMVTTGTQIQEDLPTDHGWIVHNTETLFNIQQCLFDKKPVTDKYIHIDGNVPRHRCLKVPIGTPATDLLESAGIENKSQLENQILADGGPGWCYKIDQPPDQFGVRKRTNAILVVNETLAANHTQEDGQIDVLEEQDWKSSDDRPHDQEPTELLPDRVRIPLITNNAYIGFVEPSSPIVEPGATVTKGELIAESVSDAISNPQHASITGTVTNITDTHIIIDRE
jgi:Na+-translocating ferredoxin:NAD+ oxidoreductase RnfC subunit